MIAAETYLAAPHSFEALLFGLAIVGGVVLFGAIILGLVALAMRVSDRTATHALIIVVPVVAAFLLAVWFFGVTP